MEFSSKLIALRKKKGLSQEDLAITLNVSRQSVSKWESKQSLPELDKVIQLSNIFSVPIDYLLKDDVIIEDQEDVDIITQHQIETYLKDKKRIHNLFSFGILTIFVSLLPLVLAFIELTNFSNLNTGYLILNLVIFTLLVAISVGFLILSKEVFKGLLHLKDKNYYYSSEVKDYIKKDFDTHKGKMKNNRLVLIVLSLVFSGILIILIVFDLIRYYYAIPLFILLLMGLKNYIYNKLQKKTYNYFLDAIR